MPVVTIEDSIAANATETMDLSPFDRFGGGGGQVAVRSTVIAASTGNVTMDLLLGSDTIISSGPIFAEPVVGGGPNGETPVVAGFGAPGDPITLRYSNTTGTAIVVRAIVDIRNA